MGDKCVIKRSVIGRNCKIGDRVKLTNSILMDNVVLEEGAVIQGSVICSNSRIGSKSELKDCLVGYNQDVVTTSNLLKYIHLYLKFSNFNSIFEGKYSNETIIEVDSWIDE